MLQKLLESNGESSVKENVLWGNVLAICLISAIFAGVSLGVNSIGAVIGMIITGAVASKMIFDNRNNIRKSRSIDRVLLEAVTREPTDIRTIERCLIGNYRNLRRPFGYRKIEINDLFEFEGRRMTMLHLAAEKGKADLILDLIQRGADCNLKVKINEVNLTPFETAIINNQVMCIESFMRDRNNAVEVIQRHERTGSLIHLAARYSSSDTIQKLLETISEIKYAGAESRQISMKKMLESQDAEGYTPLHIAARYGNVDAIKGVFGKYGVNFKVVNSKTNETPLMLVEKHLSDRYLKDSTMESLLSSEEFFTLTKNAEEMINVEAKVKRAFEERFRSSGSLAEALAGLEFMLSENVEQRLARVAVIGPCGGGKSSLVNAFAKEEVAEAGLLEDLTRYPQEYVIKDGDNVNRMLIVDFPGFGSENYTYENFEKHFNWTAYDLVIVAVDDKLGIANINKCILAAMKATMCKNVIFICTHLDATDDVAKDKEDYCIMINKKMGKALCTVLSDEYSKKTKITESKKLQKYADEEMKKYPDITSRTENKNVFFVKVRDPEQARDDIEGFAKLEQYVYGISAPDRLRSLRVHKNREILNGIKEDLKRRILCPRIIDTQWILTLGSFVKRDKALNIVRAGMPEVKTDREGQLLEQCQRISGYIDDLKKMLVRINKDDMQEFGEIIARLSEYAGFVEQGLNALPRLEGIFTSIAVSELQNSTELVSRAKDVHLELLNNIQQSLSDIQKLLMCNFVNSSECILMKLIKNQHEDRAFMQSLSYIVELIDPIDLSIKDNKGNTLIMHAINDIEILKSLIGRNAYLNGPYYSNANKYLNDLSIANNEGITPLMKAVVDTSPDKFCYIIHCLCFLYTSSGKYNLQDCIASLLKAKDGEGKTVLMHSIESGNPIARLLMGEDIRDARGVVPQEAVTYMARIFRSINLLNDKDINGKTALDYANEKKDTELVGLFKSRNVDTLRLKGGEY